MGLFNARNLRKAKNLLDNNRHKVGGIVEKAGSSLDKVSKGKTSNLTSKATDAANKYSQGSSANHHGIDTPHKPMPGEQGYDRGHDAAAQAQVAGAMTGVANAMTNLLNTTAKKIEEADPNVVADATKQSAEELRAAAEQIPRDVDKS